MLTYLAVLVAVALLLYACFRVLAGGEPMSVGDARALLGRLAELTQARSGELAEALAVPLTAATSASSTPGRAPLDPLVDAAAAARKQLAGYLEQLGRLQSRGAGEEREQLDNARALIAAAAEDLVWACRMIEGGGYRDNRGLENAVVALRQHGEDCLAAAARLD